jgi:DNA ligase (NAD+)
MNNTERIQALVEELNAAAFAYYVEDKEIMSNYEYDAKYDELLKLEEETGIILENSPTQNAGTGYETVSELQKSQHEYPALSLDKTKDRHALISWLKGKKGVLSWKLDGLTIVVTYEDGKLSKAVTRGDGYVGDDVTHNAHYFLGLPKIISYKKKLIVRCEAIMTYTEFDKINHQRPDTLARYKNSRNLASATVRLYDSKESMTREINACAFELVHVDNYEEIPNSNSKKSQLDWLSSLGFNVVSHTLVDETNIITTIDEYEEILKTNDFPSDGLVLIFDDEQYGKSLGMTGKYPRNGIAFKWKDETYPTVLREIQWSASRTGLLNPVAIFDPVEIDGTTVSRASIHNVSIAKDFRLGIGSEIEVFKANVIIPQIAKTVKSTGETQIPAICPVCGGKTQIKVNDDVETLYCTNTKCIAKQIGKFTHFVSRDAMNIIGLSEATLKTFIGAGFISQFSDIYHLDKYKEEIVKMNGFGKKSYDNLMKSINNSKTVKFSALLSAIGISGIGKDMAKQISKHLGENALNKFIIKLQNNESFENIDSIGTVINENIYDWKSNPANWIEFDMLISDLVIQDDVMCNATSNITGKVFVITGSINRFKNRDELKNYIEQNGGKTSGSVSSKTDYLINNDVSSNSSKNKKAKELGVPVISEDEFLRLL